VVSLSKTSKRKEDVSNQPGWALRNIHFMLQLSIATNSAFVAFIFSHKISMYEVYFLKCLLK